MLDRKLMSVIVEDVQDQKIYLFSKGAESSVLERCNFRSREEQVLRELTLKHIDDFAKVCDFLVLLLPASL